MKKKSFSIPFKSNFFKEQDPFHLVIIFFIIFFGTAIFFSIPTFYDYKKYNQKIENTINQDFKFKIYNLEDISFRFIPSPHLLIKKADLKIEDNEKDPVSKLKNIKVFISLTDLYKKDEFKIKKIVIKKANLYFNKYSGINLINNLKKNIINHLIIERSTFFFKDKNEEIILISNIQNLDYKIDLVNNKKILSINGNIFDSNFNLNYFIDYKQPNIQNLLFNLKNPNVNFNNKLIEDIYSLDQKQEGKMLIKFLNNLNEINYNIINDNIIFKNKNLNNSNFDINGSINLKPFYFDLQINLKKIDLKNLENLFYSVYQKKESDFKNLSGILKINFDNIDYKNLKNGALSLSFEDSNVNVETLKLNIFDFAILEINEYEYLSNVNEILQMKIKINITDKDKFNRFLFNYKKDVIDEDNIYFTYQYNLNNGDNSISTISKKGFFSNNEFYKFRNLQQLKNLLRDDNLLKLD